MTIAYLFRKTAFPLRSCVQSKLSHNSGARTGMVSSELTAMSQLILQLMTLQQQRATGELVLTLDKKQAHPWRLFLYMGRIAYATGGSHPTRRWYRAMRSHCPDFFEPSWQETYHVTTEYWDTEVIHQAVAAGKISATQARSVIQNVVQEVFFTFIERQTLNLIWNPGVQLAGQSTFLSIEQVIQEALQLREQWRNQGLGSLQELLREFSPDLAPIIRNPELLQAKVTPPVYKNLTRLMRGKLNLWDIAIHMNKPLPAVMRSILPLLRQGALGLKTVPDALPPLTPPETPPPLIIPTEPKYRIACVDDSPLIITLLTEMLIPEGYDVIPITDPLQGIAKLLAEKPDLILLDLMMPSTNGYELCNFLRKTTLFNRTPIVILTSRDKMVDRMRAKQVGASDFLTKPPDPEKVLATLNRLLTPLEASRRSFQAA